MLSLPGRPSCGSGLANAAQANYNRLLPLKEAIPMRRNFHDGRQDGLHPVRSLNPDKIHSFSDLLSAMGRTSFGGRRLGEAFEVLKAMVFDPECFVVGTFSGAMTIAKMGTLICRMIDHGMIQAVVTTGALLAHGFSESIGCVHYKTNPRLSDADLFSKGYNRVYDTIEPEANLNHVEQVFRKTLERIGPDEVLCSERLTRELGCTLAEHYKGDGMLKSAFLKNVPVYIPAFTDSEVGLDLSTWAMSRAGGKAGRGGARTRKLPLECYLASMPRFNPFLDLNSYAGRITEQKRIGIFTIGGGVPRNWAQQVGPYIDITNHRLGTTFQTPRFSYGVRICPEPDYWGGLSGCTYSEGVSWGKFVAPEKGGLFAEVLSDATLVWPLLVQGMLEEMDRRKGRPPARRLARRRHRA
jgi:deoxyhypusine synthase